MHRNVALGALVLGGVYLALVLRMQVGSIEDPVGPRMFPTLIAIGIFVTGIMIWFEGSGGVQSPAAPVVDSAEEKRIRRDQAIGVAGVAGGSIVFVLLLDHLGFPISAFLLMQGMLTAFNRGKHALNVVVALGVSAALYIGLKQFLGVSLPVGLLG
jgi:putative tricarboxylic transport membrane protein